LSLPYERDEKSLPLPNQINGTHAKWGPSMKLGQTIFFGMRHALAYAIIQARPDMIEMLIRYGARAWKGK
jgi:hypothetical protein